MEVEFEGEGISIKIKYIEPDVAESPAVDAIYEVKMSLPKIGLIRFKIVGYDDGEVELEPII